MNDEFKNIEAERNELNILIAKGATFDVDRIVRVKKAGLLGHLGRKEVKHEVLTYTIKEPTLATLDMIAAEQIDLVIDENIMVSESGVQEAKKMAHEHGRRLARIVAIAVLGEEYYLQSTKNGRTVYEKDEHRLNELTDIFFHNVKPSKLVQLTIFINTIANLGDFTNSIRLMSAARTTMPIRIEANKKV